MLWAIGTKELGLAWSNEYDAGAVQLVGSICFTFFFRFFGGMFCLHK